MRIHRAGRSVDIDCEQRDEPLIQGAWGTWAMHDRAGPVLAGSQRTKGHWHASVR